MEELEKQLKPQRIEALNLEDMSPEDIEGDAPLFGDGLGLDSIDALELIVLLEKHYGIRLHGMYLVIIHPDYERYYCIPVMDVSEQVRHIMDRL